MSLDGNDESRRRNEYHIRKQEGRFTVVNIRKHNNQSVPKFKSLQCKLCMVIIVSLSVLLFQMLIAYGSYKPTVITNDTILQIIQPSNRLNLQNCQNIDIGALPLLMTPDEMTCLCDHVIKCSQSQRCNYLEWGSGGSTQLVSVLLDNSPSIHAASIEHATEWCTKLITDSAVKIAIAVGKLNYYCVDTKVLLARYGRPQYKDNKTLDKMLKYINWIDKINSTLYYDLVLIDGRFRVACALKLIIGHYIDQQSVVLMHDYIGMDREYEYVETYYTKVNLIQRLAVLKLKTHIDYIQLAKDFDRFRYDPER